MTIQFSLDEDDFAYLTQYSMRRQQRGNWKTVLLRLAAPIAIIGMAMTYLAGGAWDPIILVYIVFMIVVAVAGIVLRYRSPSGIWKRYVQKQYGGTRGLLGERMLQISGDGIAQRTLYIESKAQWPSIADVINDKSYILIVHTKTGMLMGYYVPKRAFATPELAEKFYQTAVAYWKGESPPEASESGADAVAAVWPPPPQFGGL